MSTMKLSEVKELQGDEAIKIMCHKGDIDIVNDRPDVFEINPERTLKAASIIDEDGWRYLKTSAPFMRYFRMIFPDYVLDDTPLAAQPVGVRHAVGLIVASVGAVKAGHVIFWKFPETYLHPLQQLGLADFAIALTDGSQ